MMTIAVAWMLHIIILGRVEDEKGKLRASKIFVTSNYEMKLKNMKLVLDQS